MGHSCSGWIPPQLTPPTLASLHNQTSPQDVLDTLPGAIMSQPGFFIPQALFWRLLQSLTTGLVWPGVGPGRCVSEQKIAVH